MADPIDLPDQLRALGRAVPVRVPDDLADRVLTEIAAVPVRRTRALRRWATAVASLVIAAAVPVVVSAPVRAAFINVFGFGGVQVRTAPGPAPAATPTIPDEHLVEIDEAQREVGFRIRIPSVLGEPDSVTVADGRVVSLHYTRTDGPVRIDQFPGDLGVMWEKYAVGPAQRTEVGGREALWFDDPVTLVYVDERGIERTESARRTAGTLVWMDGGLTFRLDGVRPLQAAVAVAGSMT